MTVFLLDTSVLVDIERGMAHAMSFARDASLIGDELACSVVTIAEWRIGAPRGLRPRMDAFTDSLHELPMDRAVAERAASYQFSFARRGIQIHLADALIAATALSHNATLVTENRKDFPMDDIAILSLRD